MIAVTRIRLKHVWLIVPALIRFRRLYAGAQADPGSVRGQVAVAGPRTLVNLSVWRSRWAMLRWSGRRGHVDAVRWTYGQAAEVWSTEWELSSVSPSTNRWHSELLLEAYSIRLP